MIEPRPPSTAAMTLPRPAQADDHGGRHRTAADPGGSPGLCSAADPAASGDRPAEYAARDPGREAARRRRSHRSDRNRTCSGISAIPSLVKPPESPPPESPMTEAPRPAPSKVHTVVPRLGGDLLDRQRLGDRSADPRRGNARRARRDSARRRSRQYRGTTPRETEEMAAQFVEEAQPGRRRGDVGDGAARQ